MKIQHSPPPLNNDPLAIQNFYTVLGKALQGKDDFFAKTCLAIHRNAVEVHTIVDNCANVSAQTQDFFDQVFFEISGYNSGDLLNYSIYPVVLRNENISEEEFRALVMDAPEQEQKRCFPLVTHVSTYRQQISSENEEQNPQIISLLAKVKETVNRYFPNLDNPLPLSRHPQF